MRLLLLLLAYLPFLSLAAEHLVMEGVHLPATRELNGVTLYRNGQGLRLFQFMGMNLRIYVAGFWTAQRLETPEAVMACDKPKQMDFTFLRNVSKGKVTTAWQLQLDSSVTHRYDGYLEDRDAFLSLLGAIQTGGTQSVLLIGNETLVIDQEEFRGKITGKDFQRAFLSMWFGESAVTPDLKSGLLGHELLAVAA